MRKPKYTEKIIEILKSGGLLTASQIHEKINEADLATIYRNLAKLCLEGEIKEVNINKGESSYEINKDNHQHAQCNKCGKVYHLDIDKTEILKRLDLKDFNFNVEDVEIIIKGKCK